MSTSSKPVVVIGRYFPRSIELEGVGSLMRGLAEGFVLAGWDVRLLIPQGEYRPVPGATLSFYRPGLLGGLLRYRRAIAETTRDADAALFIENSPNMVGPSGASRCPASTFALFASPLTDLGVLREMGFRRQTLTHLLGKHHCWSRLFRWSNRRCIVGSEYQALQLRRLGAREVHVLAVSGVPSSKAIPSRVEARAILGWDDRPAIGYVGHFSAAKGVEVLIDAFARLEGPAVLALAHSGKGRLRPAAAATLERLVRQGRARLVGVTEVTTFMAACDVTCLPFITSSAYHQPQVMLESFAASTAVVTSRRGGLGELIDAHGLGRMAPPSDPAALAGVLREALDDLPALHAMGRAARERFVSDYCVESFLQRLYALARS